jgi:hypothetical protein
MMIMRDLRCRDDDYPFDSHFFQDFDIFYFLVQVAIRALRGTGAIN